MAHPCVRTTAATIRRLLSHCRITDTACAVGGFSFQRDVQTDSTNKCVDKKVLSLSSLIRQDGLEIQELPIIVKRASQTFSPFSKILSCVDSVKKQTEQDESFKLNLQNCATVKQVFKLLEVPSDQVTGYSAAFALQRISQLAITSFAWDGDGIDTFIRTAVMNELYDTVIRDIQCLENETLISLVKCYLSSDNFNKKCTLTINSEIENRLADSTFDITDLCILSNLLSRHKRGDSDIVDKIWAHVGMRASDLNENNITDVYRCLPATHKYLVKVLDKKLLKCWWKLTGEDVANIVPCLVRLNSENRLVLSAFGKWVFVNFHSLSDAQLTNIVAGFVKFNFSEHNLMKALERYVPAKGIRLDTNLLALVMEYNRSQRHLSPCIMDAAAQHFQHNSRDYKPLQAYSVLRAFGYLNFVPSNPGELFLKIEEYIERKFYKFTIPHIVELLCSFNFIGRFPINFTEKVFSTSFLSRAHSLNDEVIKAQTGKWLEMYQSAIILECKGRVSNLYKLWAPARHCWMDERHHMVHTQLYNALRNLVGENVVVRARLSNRSAYFIDFTIWCDPDGRVLNKEMATTIDYLYPYKYAMLVQMPESYCVNTGHLLGEYAMRNRHLKCLAYNIIEFPYEEVRHLTGRNREAYILRKLPKILRKHLSL